MDIYNHLLKDKRVGMTENYIDEKGNLRLKVLNYGKEPEIASKTYQEHEVITLIDNP